MREGGSTPVSVVMPTYGQAAFIGRAIGSLLAQEHPDWQLLVVDDGSPDETREVVQPFLADSRITYERAPCNRGLGAALNRGLDLAAGAVVAYLPSDDRWDPHHLSALVSVLDESVVLAWSGVVHHGSQRAMGAPPGMPLQLVQAAHRRTPARWIERPEAETDDLDVMFWAALRATGATASTGVVTCEWTDHPGQRHKAMLERFDGGLNVFRRRYRIETPLRFRSSDSGAVDEETTYARFRGRVTRSAGARGGLRILVVGELGYNPERVLAFEERGHQLFGLWTDDNLGSQAVGPLPFGDIVDVPLTRWAEVVSELRPDVVYALLSWRAVPLAHAVLRGMRDVPFVWHFKESPMRSMRRGTWRALADLVTEADLCLLSSEEELAWFRSALPGRLDAGRTGVLDGDLPKAEWLEGPPGRRLSEDDGEVHTVVLGRPIGLDAGTARRLAASGIHLHLHGLVRGPGMVAAGGDWVDEAVASAPGHVHVERHVAQPDWRRVVSRYDAGWLHAVPSRNRGHIGGATWDDLNVPARLPVYLAAGIPVLQRRSQGAAVAAQRIVQEERVGVLFDDIDELVSTLHDPVALSEARQEVARVRHRHTFDHHVDDLLSRFRSLQSQR